MVVRYYSSTARETTLSGTITSGATSITVASVLGFPANTPYTLALSYETSTEELVQVDNAAGTNLTVVRGIDGTSATSHNAGARIRHVTSARDSADSRNHENSNQGVHGLAPGDVLVGQTATQSLTNKTLVNPVINTPTVTDPTVTGTQAGNLSYSGESTYTGTRAIRINNAPDISPTSTTHSFQIGADNTENIRMDGNEIMSVNNGVAGNLALQNDGGAAALFAATGTDSVTSTFNVRGVVDANTVQVGRAAAVSTAITTKADADAVNRLTVRADGLHSWGDGTNASDTNLFRGAADQLRTNDSLQVDGTISADGNVSSGGNVTATGSLIGRNLKAGTIVTPLPGGSGGTTTVAVTFPAMASQPYVVAQVDTAANPANTNIQWYVTDITTTGFTITCFRSSNSVTRFSWIAVAA